MLHYGTADRDSAGAGTAHGEMRRRSVVLLDEVLRGRDHIVDGVLLGFFSAGVMPGFPELSTATDVHDGKYASAFNPRQNARIEIRVERDGVGAIALEQSGMRAVER